MAQLLKLAQRYQRALDGIDGSTRDAAHAAGQALWRAVHAAELGGSSQRDLALRPVVLQTALATSIVAHFERIPWAAVAQQMLRRPQGTPLSEVQTCNNLLKTLLQSSCASGPVAALLLRQVWPPSFLPVLAAPCPRSGSLHVPPPELCMKWLSLLST